MERDVVVVPAKVAYPEYLRYAAYVCQPNRAFQAVERMAFYTSNAIQREVPRILAHQSAVPFTEATTASFRRSGDPMTARIGEIVDSLLQNRDRDAGVTLDVYLLSPPSDPQTMVLPQPILNTTTTASGKRIAWTQGHRYTTSEALARGPETTADLDALVSQ